VPAATSAGQRKAPQPTTRPVPQPQARPGKGSTGSRVTVPAKQGTQDARGKTRVGERPQPAARPLPVADAGQYYTERQRWVEQRHERLSQGDGWYDTGVERSRERTVEARAQPAGSTVRTTPVGKVSWRVTTTYRLGRPPVTGWRPT